MRRALPLLLALLAAPVVAAQVGPDPLGSRPRVYVGGGFGPGFGGVAMGTDPVFTVFTREVAVYADYVPRVTGGSGRLLTAVGLGGAIRTLRIADIARNQDPGALDVDLGLRIGPSFYTAFFEQSAESRSRAFSVMIDPFARVTLRRESGRVFFAEVGTQAPALRAGLSTSIRFPGR
ncbi:hypothetical protein [Rubrivirga marina]|uniref:Outer membrane protein beta-barrel domain-containing protein n=1 Tax=Rubrivirga marina TaxID=1196024 RepID=A0A271IWC8_9BACT|nr:hypothetical protein [Rubrivirga marina]PAP75536.1 hypothetical protein BSZ37_03305 [Rubrivirga marina]